MATELAEKKGSILSMMAASITDRKAAAATGLTPVAGEGGRPVVARLPDLPGAYMPQEAIEAVIRNIRHEAAALLKTADELETALGIKKVWPVADVKDEVKAAEKAADTKFAADFAAKQAEAQAATFKSETPLTALPNMVEDAPAGWVCPEHGTAKDKRSPKGRDYRGCATDGCKNFELPS